MVCKVHVLNFILEGAHFLNSIVLGGLGFHISAAWVIFYSFLSSFVDSCVELHSISTKDKNLASDLPKKYLASYSNYDGNYALLRKAWEDKKETANEYCSKHSSSEEICTYSWMVRNSETLPCLILEWKLELKSCTNFRFFLFRSIR
jgi:hypothetical protein